MSLSKKQYKFIENIVFQKIYESYNYFIAANPLLSNLIKKIDRLIALDIELINQNSLLQNKLFSDNMHIEKLINEIEGLFKNKIKIILDFNRNIKKLFESAILLDLMNFFYHKLVKDDNELYDICYALEKKFSYNLCHSYLKDNFSYDNILLFTDKHKENIRSNLQKILDNFTLESIALLKKNKINYSKAGKNFAILLKSDFIINANIIENNPDNIIDEIYRYIDMLYLKLWVNPIL